MKFKAAATAVALTLIATVLALAAFSYINPQKFSFLLSKIPLLRRLAYRTVDQAVDQYGAAARLRLAAKYQAAGVTYPPAKTAFMALKESRELLIYSAPQGGSAGDWRYICTYPIMGASGTLGPKLREGDRQVPEGIYSLSPEPNTPFHVALRLNYPNQIDLARAKADGRANPGHSILMHGTMGSVGCLAMGDEGSEDTFILAHDTMAQPVTLVIAPLDLRVNAPPTVSTNDPAWLPELYKEIKDEMSKFPAVPVGSASRAAAQKGN